MIMATFTRASVAHKQDGSQVASGVPRYEAGQNGQAIMVEEGTVNLLPLDLGQWTQEVGATRTLLGETYLGQPVYRGCSAAGDSHIAPFRANAAGVAVGDWLTLSFYARAYNGNAAGSAHISGVDTGAWSVPNDGQWHRVAISRQATTTSGTCEIRTAAGPNKDLDFCAGQVEKKPYATSFTLGTRAAENLSLSISTLDPANFCVEFDCLITAHTKRQVAGTFPRLITLDADNAAHGGGRTEIIIYHSPTSPVFGVDLWKNNVGSGLAIADALIPNGWRRLAIRGTATAVEVLCDGVVISSQTVLTNRPTAFTSCYPGQSKNGGSGQINTLFDRIRLFRRPLSDAELRASFEGRL